MRVLFSNPPWVSTNPDGTYQVGVRAGSRWPFTTRQTTPIIPPQGYVPFPFFLAYAASYVRQAMPDVDVHFRDSIALRESYQAWIEWTGACDPTHLVIESATPSWDHDAGLLRWLAQSPLFTDVKIIVTGPIATAKGAEILREHPNVVACVKGEYEKGVVRVLKGECGVIDHDLLSVAEMNAAPSPWLDADHAHRYFDANPQGQRFPQLQAWTSRGCPYKCIFCVWPAAMTGNDPDGQGKRSVRYYGKEWLQAYLADTIRRYGYQSVYFDDDTMNLSDRHTLNVCEVMHAVSQSVGRSVPWSAMCRADTITTETWIQMHLSGCFGVKIGFESGSQYVLDHIVNKRLNLGRAVQTLRLLKEIGITCHTTWTVGLPGETPAQQQETFTLIQRLHDEGLHRTHQLSGTAPIEGTPLATLLQVGKLAKYDGASADGFDRTSDGMSKLHKMAGR